jgi:superfamily I DNA/RNA helicase/RecB family exonuclease
VFPWQVESARAKGATIPQFRVSEAGGSLRSALSVLGAEIVLVAVTYRIERAERPVAAAPELDADQRAVVDHPGGPLLVLAGPGTGKTTTLVEAVVDRVERRGLDPAQVLVLTFGRKAAVELRDRITSRLRRTTASPISSTFHSFCYAVLRRVQPADLYATPLRLLSSPEQDVRLRELLAGAQGLGTVTWPQSLHAALGTRGFAGEVHGLLSRARELGMTADELAEAGRRAARPEWVAAAGFMEEYLTVLDFEGALDYAELIHRTAILAETPEVRADLRRRFAAVFVDEYQDTDPAQVRLLQAIAGDGRDLVVVGDPDQSIYAFRGADVRGILDFPTQFPCHDGGPAPVVALGVTRRFGTRLLAASRGIAAGIGISGAIDIDTFRKFRDPVVSGTEHGAGRVEVLTFSSAGAQAEHIADIVRRCHLEDDVAWSDIAVLVRSGVLSIPALRRALVAAGVPVTVAGDEVPLQAEPAVQPLLVALSASVRPAAITVETALLLLSSPLGDVDAAAVRRLGRELRRRSRVNEDGLLPAASSAELLRLGLVEPVTLADIDDPAAGAVRRLGLLLAEVHRGLAAGQPPEEALWTLWQGTPWPRRLRAAVERGGPGARAAARDLDSICALFEVAARAEERQQHTSVPAFLAEIQAQQIPADTRADSGNGARRDAVRLLTAHRSKGLEWRVVVIAGVQEGSWPDVRRRGSLLGTDRLDREGAVEPPSVATLLAEERRLFYVAATRARERLIVTAVAAPEQDGEQPSRLLAALGRSPQNVVGRPQRPMSLAGLVASLRRVASDADASEGMRRAAAARLARLASERVGERPVAPAADPGHWWGLRELSEAAVPVRPVDEPVGLSGSALQGVLECPLRWFLGREAAGTAARSASMGFGSVIHVLADHLAKDETATTDDLMGLLDSVWPSLDFESRWIADRERADARAAVERLVAWHASRPGRTLVASEADFDVTVSLEHESARLTGRVDRLERGDDGALHVIDLKTGKNPPRATALAEHPQLGVYQLATDRGAFAGLADGPSRSGGAELVHVRARPGEGQRLPLVQRQPPQDVDGEGTTPVERQLATAAATIREERFSALAGDQCRTCEFAATCPVQLRGGSVLS